MATAGTFVFRLTVADNVGATATDNIQIIVNAASNQAPTANAGTDITITLPTSSASLNGSGSDPDGTISTYAWTKVSGPAGGTIGSPATSSTAITGMTTQGTYVFRLTITDNGGATIFDDVQIIVNSAPIPNQTPIANAGTDITITLPTSSATLNGLGTDPDGTISTYAWTKVSGPVGGVIGSSSTASTGITSMNSAGTYVYRLTVTDNRSATGSDDVQIIVNDAPAPAPAPAPNQTPSSNSGADITITLPTNSATLNGSGTDPDGTISFYVWTKVSGPVGGVIGSSSTASTGITSMNTAGTYTYKLTVTDNGGATGSDDVQIIVISAPAPAPTPAPAPAPNQAPTANAGANIAVALPISSTILSGSGTDPDGTITSYAWTKISGPSGETIASPGTASTTISGLTAGDFVYRLTVTDNGGATAASDIVVNVTDPSKAPVPTPTPNQAPIANAGQDLTLILPANGTLLNGTLSNDPDGSIVNWSWSLIQGPAGSTLANSTSSSPSLTVTRRGTYTFELTVTDDLGLTSTDRMTVNVIRYNKRPRAMTTYDSTTVKLPVQNTLVEGSSSYDSDGSITSYNWSYVSGPSSYKILSPDSANTVISNLTQGSYQFALEVTDDDSAADKKIITIIVKNSSSRMEILDVKMRPNPAVNDVYITINSDVQGRSTITLVDIKGTPVYREVFDKSSYSITRNLKVNSLRKGTYFVVIKVDGSIQMMKKLIVL